MQLGVVGLGRMGANIVRRLMGNSHDCVVCDVNADAVRELAGEGASASRNLVAANEEAVPAEVISAALYTRFRSRREHTFAEKLFSAMRRGFGGHVEPQTGGLR